MNKNSLWREETGDFGSPMVVKEHDEEKKPVSNARSSILSIVKKHTSASVTKQTKFSSLFS